MSRDKDEIEISDYLDSQTLANSATENQQEKQELVNMVYDDVSFVRKAMDYKVELDCMRIASSGVQTFPERLKATWHHRTSSTSTYRRATSSV